MIGADRVQTNYNGFQLPPITYPSLLLNPTGGNVGIGTTLPGAKLDIFHNSTNSSPSLLITEEGQDAGRIQFRNSNNSNYYEISASPGAPGPLVQTMSLKHFDGNSTKSFMSYRADRTMEINTGTNAVTYINYSNTDAYTNELRVGVVSGGQNVNIKNAMRIYGNGESSYWDIKSTNNLTFGHSDGTTTGDKAYIDSDGEYHQISDFRLKEDIQPLKNCLKTLLSLSPTKYYFKQDKTKSKQSIGFIAQEVNKVFPEAVKYDEDNDVYTVAYKNFTVLAVGAIKEQDELMQELSKQHSEHKKEIQKIQKRISKIQEKLNK